MEKAREFQKNIYFCFIDYTKAFDCVDHNKFLNENIRPPYLSPEKPVYRLKQHLELDMEQQTDSKLEGCIQSLCLFNLYADYTM